MTGIKFILLINISFFFLFCTQSIEPIIPVEMSSTIAVIELTAAEKAAVTYTSIIQKNDSLPIVDSLSLVLLDSIRSQSLHTLKNSLLTQLQSEIQTYLPLQDSLIGEAKIRYEYMLNNGGNQYEINSSKNTYDAAVIKYNAVSKINTELFSIEIMSSSSLAVAVTPSVSSGNSIPELISSVGALSSIQQLSSSGVISFSSSSSMPVDDTIVSLSIEKDIIEAIMLLEDAEDQLRMLTAEYNGGGELSWSIQADSVVGVATIGAEGAEATLTYSVNDDAHGDQDIVVIVTDSILSDSVSILAQVQSVNDFPVYVGQAVLEGALLEEEVITLNPGSECTDPHDTDSNSTLGFKYQWFRTNSSNTFSASPIATSESYALASDDIGRYMYGIVSCVDDSNSVVHDTTDFSAAVEGLVKNYVLGFDSTQHHHVTLQPMDVSFDLGLTIESWINLESVEGVYTIVEIGNGVDASNNPAKNIVLKVEDSGLTFIHHTGTQWSYTNDSGAVHANTWTHVAASVNSVGETALYINGIRRVFDTLSVVSSLERGVNYIGRSSSTDKPAYFKGTMDNVRIWSGVRTAQEIYNNMKLSFDLLTAPDNLVAYYDFNHESGTILTDKTGFYSGTLVNMLGNEWILEDIQ